MLRDFYNPDYCKIKWEETYLNGYRSKPSPAMLDGLVFEQKVIGMSRGGEVYEIPKGKTGKPLKRETDLIALAEKSKVMMRDLGIELVDVQPEWETDEHDGWEGLVMLYTPQSEAELEIIFQLIVESYNHVTGQTIQASDIK